MINKDTQLCISVASRPSNFGTTLHNAGYAELDLNFLYKAFGISDISGAIEGVRALGIRGCSVSMPFKRTVIPHLDLLDETARIVGAVNTIVNNEGHLTGYNTDVAGARASLESIHANPRESVLVVGAGGVAGAILFALRQMGFKKVQVTNRSVQKIQQLNSILPCNPVAWDARQNEPADLLINATSVGMNPDADLMPLDEAFIRQSRAVMDVVISPMETRLIACARSAEKAVAPGYLMSLQQAASQFFIYTNKNAPMEIFESALRKMLAS